ncbi:MAG TPA: thioredoxin domain-containing protein [Gaiellaceae bacterium]
MSRSKGPKRATSRPPTRRPNPRRRQLLITLAAALLVAAALIAVSRLSADSKSSNDSSSSAQGEVKGAAESRRLLAGIPQNGTVLGDPNAPVTLVEYADLQCPFCQQWALGTLPTLVEDYVRPGKLRIEFRGLAFIGPDSATALQNALAAGQQDKLWNVVDLLYQNQGQENSGWVTDELIDGIAASVPGLDADQLATDRSKPAINAQMAQAAAQANAAGVNQTPFFQIGGTGEPLHTLQFTSLEPKQFQDAIEAELGK